MFLIVRLSEALAAADIHAIGATIGDPNDKSTWVVFFDGSETDEDKAAAQTIIDNFVV